NWLEEWWIRIHDGQNAGLERNAAFLRTVARLTSASFDAIFGPHLFSLRCLGVSMAYSLASINATFILVGNRQISVRLWLVLFLLLGTSWSPPRWAARFRLTLPVVAVLLFFLVSPTGFTIGALYFMHFYGRFPPIMFTTPPRAPVIFACALVMAILSDL